MSDERIHAEDAWAKSNVATDVAAGLGALAEKQEDAVERLKLLELAWKADDVADFLQDVGCQLDKDLMADVAEGVEEAIKEIAVEIPEALNLRTVQEVAGMLRVSAMTCYRLIKAKQLGAVKVGKNFRIPQKAVDEYLERSAKGGVNG